jgi:hypothetical protein
VIELIEPNHRGVGIGLKVGKQEFPLWVNPSDVALTTPSVASPQADEDYSERAKQGTCNSPFIAQGSVELGIRPMITDRCELPRGHAGRHKQGNATWGSGAAAPVGEPGRTPQSNEAYLLEVIASARDYISSEQKAMGYLPMQQAYSTTMTDAEKRAAKVVADLDEILAAPIREPVRLSDDWCRGCVYPHMTHNIHCLKLRDAQHTPLQHTSPGGVAVPAHVMKHEYCPACMAAPPAQGAPTNAVVSEFDPPWEREAQGAPGTWEAQFDALIKQWTDRANYLQGVTGDKTDTIRTCIHELKAALAQPGAPTKEG